MDSPGLAQDVIAPPVAAALRPVPARYGGLSRRAALIARFSLAVLVLAAALGLRVHAVGSLPIDFDEDDYLRAGQLYAEGFRTGDLGVLTRENYRSEHPPLSKIVTGLAILPLDPAPLVPDLPTTAQPAASLPQPHLDTARTAQAVMGAMAAFALALLDPLGGLLLAIHTFSVKYSSQVMLESAPALAAVLAALLATAATRTDGRRRTVLLATAGVAFGLACAGKYLYGVVGIAIAAEWLFRTRPASEDRAPARLGRWLAPVGGWFALAFVVFLAANPYLWPDPAGRLVESITFHSGYAGSDAVRQTGWPIWQPFVWLMGSVPFHGPGTFLVAADLAIGILAVAGFRRLWHRHRVFALWLVIALAFLLLWPTKWPQYLLVLSAPLGLAAAHGLRAHVLEPAARTLGASLIAGRRRLDGATGGAPRTWSRPGRRQSLRSLGSAAPWLLPGVLGLAILVAIPLLYQGAMALTDLTAMSLRDGIQGGVVREAVGGLTGRIEASPVAFNQQTDVSYVGFELFGQLQAGLWLGANSSAFFLAFSVIWMVLAVTVQAVGGVLAGLALAQPGLRFAPAWRTLFILPWAIPEFVGAVAWYVMLHPEQGWLPLLVGGPVPWPTSPEISLLVLLLVAGWMGFPLVMLVTIAGLRTVPRSSLEAAMLEGAGAWTRFRLVTLPLLMPLLAPALLIRGIASFNQFYLFYVFGALEGSIPATLPTFSFWMFNTGFGGAGLFATSAAINLLGLVALGLLVAWYVRWRARAERFVSA
jgi:ABC-type sugar transport system permease subunit